LKQLGKAAGSAECENMWESSTTEPPHSLSLACSLCLFESLFLLSIVWNCAAFIGAHCFAFFRSSPPSRRPTNVFTPRAARRFAGLVTNAVKLRLALLWGKMSLYVKFRIILFFLKMVQLRLKGIIYLLF